MKIQSYRELRAWQNSMRLAQKVYRVTKHFPREEIYALTAQIRRSAISVPSNIAEGQGRASKGEFKQFLCIARGSLFELETQFMLAKSLGYLSDQEAQELEAAIAEVAPVLSGLIRSLNEKAKYRSTIHDSRFTPSRFCLG